MHPSVTPPTRESLREFCHRWIFAAIVIKFQTTIEIAEFANEAADALTAELSARFPGFPVAVSAEVRAAHDRIKLSEEYFPASNCRYRAWMPERFDSDGNLIGQFTAEMEREFTRRMDADRSALIEFATAILSRPGIDEGRQGDDGEAVTEEWLRSIGFHADGVHYVCRGWGPHKNGSLQVYNCNEWVVNGVHCNPLKSRGAVRQLLSALGITLPGIPCGKAGE